MRRTEVLSYLSILPFIVIVFSCSGTTRVTEGSPVGSACKSSSDCANKLVCIYTTSSTSVNLFPNGYCSRYCLNDNDCPEKSKCLGNICIADCTGCEREGYTCVEGKYCVADLKIGDQCSSDSDCPTAKCLSYSDNKFKNGYCTMNCESGSDCPLSAGALCTDFEGTEGSTKVCASRCSLDAECRVADKQVCRLTRVHSAEKGDTFATVCSGVDNLGASCKDEVDCSSGLMCISESDLVRERVIAAGNFSEKICSQRCSKDSECPHILKCRDDDEDCLRTARCINGYCFRGCITDEQCAKPKYACRGFEENGKLKYFCNSVNSIGIACSTSEDCTAGLICETGDPNLKGGFCTKSCTNDSDCPREIGLEQVCLDNRCQRSCRTDEDCGRKEYLCTDYKGRKVCRSKKNYGAACESDDDCSEGLVCYKGFAFPGGYCTKEGTTSGECEGGGVPGNLGLCMRPCDKDEDCGRREYSCFTGGPNKYCSTGFNVGYPCSDHGGENIIDCNEGLRCETDKHYEFGYCTMDCEGVDDVCPTGSVCIPSRHMCMRRCSRDDHCLISDYTCRDLDNNYVCDGGKNVGAACSQDPECSSELVCDTKQVGGYCTSDCKSTDCPSGSVCIGGVCKRVCKLDKDCGRTRYFCLYSGGQSYCVGSLNIGSECNDDTDCAAPLICYKPREDKIGLCSNDNDHLCQSNTDCGESYAVCNKDGDRHCYRRCSFDQECGREDMRCDSDSNMCVYK